LVALRSTAQRLWPARTGIDRQLVQVCNQVFSYEMGRWMARFADRQRDMIELGGRLRALFQLGQLFKWITL